MPRAVIYCRVSREEQAKNFSLLTQLQACRAYAAQAHLTVLHELSDDETGATLNRPGFAALRALVETHQVDALIVYHPDRLHRMLVNQILIRNEFQSAGITIHYVQRGELLNTPEARLTDNIDGAIAEYERERTRGRTMRGTRGKVESGLVPGGGRAKYGYSYLGSGRDRALVIDEAQAQIVREIHERFRRGDTVPVLRRDLTARTVPTWTDMHGGKPRRRRAFGEWDDSAIYGILRDEAYAGTYRAFRHVIVNEKQVDRAPSEWIGVPCPAIISRELWQANQARMDANIRFNPRNTRRFYLLRGMVRCALCGAAMIGATVKRPSGREDRYYRCINTARKTVTPCTARYVSAHKLDTAVWERLKVTLYTRDAVAASLDRLRTAATAPVDHTRQRADLAARHAATITAIDRLLNLYSRDLIRADDLERQLAPLQAQRRVIEQAQHAATDTPPDPLAPLAAWLDQDWSLVQDGLAEADEFDHARRILVEHSDLTVLVTPIARAQFTYRLRSPLLPESLDTPLD